jgi:hypothetical protein
MTMTLLRPIISLARVGYRTFSSHVQRLDDFLPFFPALLPRGFYLRHPRSGYFLQDDADGAWIPFRDLVNSLSRSASLGSSTAQLLIDVGCAAIVLLLLV